MTMLFSPYRLRGVEFPNRVMIAPMCTYSAEGGLASNWHLAHLAKFAIGGAGAVMTEAAAVQERGKITHGDLGIWSDAHADALKPVIDLIQSQGSRAGVQLAHAGRKASMQRPWFGNGPLNDEDTARGDLPWDVVGPSANALDDGWLTPAEMSEGEILALVDDFVAAAKRCEAIGCDFIELHCAHGYLMQSFLSPLSNHRDDAWGGDLARRMAAPLAVAKAVRAAWPEDKPLFVRISSIDGVEGGWTMDDSVVLAKALKSVGVDIIDCSSLGNTSQGATAAPGKRGAGFQTPFSARIKSDADMPSMAVGLIVDGETAEQVLQEGRADLVAIGREALKNPFWALHAAEALGVDHFDDYPVQYGWWLNRRRGAIRGMQSDPELAALPPLSG
ncbi:MAG: NADH:flavin oxidoreductase/NADH oxidase [Pseudomonadota bacterium]